MTIRRSLTSGGAIASLLLLAAAPAPAPDPAEEATSSYGTATTTSVPLLVEALGEEVQLGRTTLIATTDDDVVAGAPWSAVELTLADVAGTAFGEIAVASDGTTTSEGATFGEGTAVGAVTATVADVLAVADDTTGTATAALTSLSTEATVLDALGLTATVSDVVTTVDGTGAAAAHSLAVADVDLDLAHVLGDVLATLPLADLLALADQLGVTVPVDLGAAGDVVAATEALLVAVTQSSAAADDVAGAAQTLLDADAGTFAALQGLQTTLEGIAGGTLDLGAVAALETLLGSSLLDDCDVTPGIATLTQDLAAVEACLAASLEAHLASLADEAAILQAAVESYLTAVGDAVTAAAALDGSSSLGDIVDGIGQLLDDLLAVDLLALGGIDVTQQVRAVGGQPDASSASTTCQLTTLSVLGGEPIELADCDGSGTPALGAIELVTTTLQAVLDTVGGVDTEGDLVQLDLFRTSQDAVTIDGDTVRATSVLEVLSLTVPDITIDACDVEVVGELVCALGLDLGLDLGDAIDDVDGVLTAAHATVTGALATVEDLLVALGLDLDVTAAADAQTAVDSALTTLLDVIAGLDLGELGTGVGATVPGARVVVDPELTAEHTVVAAAGGPPAPAPNPAPNPGDGPLPNTGGGAGLVAVLALGAGAWLWRRREQG